MNNMDQYMKLYDVFGNDDENTKTNKSSRHPYGARGKKQTVKMGATCPNCRMKKSLTGVCYCNE